MVAAEKGVAAIAIAFWKRTEPTELRAFDTLKTAREKTLLNILQASVGGNDYGSDSLATVPRD